MTPKKTRKVKREYHRVEKELTHVTAEQVLQRHLYCVPLRVLVGSRDVAETTSRLAAKGQLKAYCDHPQDGWCAVGEYPTVLELEEINNRLSGKGSSETSPEEHPVQVRRTRQESAEPKVNRYFCMKDEAWHSDIDATYITHMEFKRKRGQRLPSQLKPKEPAKFFCTKCNDWHQEPDTKFQTHLKYKRKRGRQPGWNLKAKSVS